MADLVLLEAVMRYLKLRERADHPGTAAPEAMNCRTRMQEMEADYSELLPTVSRIERALAGTAERPRFQRPPPAKGWKAAAMSVVQDLVEVGADRVADNMTGSHRFNALSRNECAIDRLPCAPEQVCIEVRVRQDDLRRPMFRQRLVDGIEAELRRR